MIENLLENIKYIEPDSSLPIPDGMCKDCIELALHDMCDDCQQQLTKIVH